MIFLPASVLSHVLGVQKNGLMEKVLWVPTTYGLLETLNCTLLSGGLTEFFFFLLLQLNLPLTMMINLDVLYSPPYFYPKVVYMEYQSFRSLHAYLLYVSQRLTELQIKLLDMTEKLWLLWKIDFFPLGKKNVLFPETSKKWVCR